MRVMYGGNSEASDQHLTGYDFDILGSFLSATGFCDIRRVKKFGIFKDSSDLWWAFQRGKAVSQEEVGEVRTTKMVVGLPKQFKYKVQFHNLIRLHRMMSNLALGKWEL